MLEQASAWLEAQRLKELSVPAVYVRKDGTQIPVNVTPGQTLFRAEDQYGVTVRTESRDFLVAASELADALKQIRELQRMLGKKTMENEILREAVEYGRSKKWIARSPSLPGEDR